MTLRDLPPVRALAEERAREHYTMRMTIAGPAYGGIPWEQVSDYQRGLSEAAHLALLADLSRPDSRDAIARLVAAKVGIGCGATAPTFCRMDRAAIRTSDPETPAFWAMWSGYSGEAQWHDFDDWPERPHRRRLPGIGAITDPAEALARVAIAVLA